MGEAKSHCAQSCISGSTATAGDFNYCRWLYLQNYAVLQQGQRPDIVVQLGMVELIVSKLDYGNRMESG